MISRFRICTGLVLLAWFLACAGCKITHSIKGKVIQGNISFVGIVDQADERLKSEGLPDVDVAARADVGSVGGYMFAQAETDPKGDFDLRFKDQHMFSKPVEFSAAKEGFRPARGQMHVPSNQRRLLIILAPGGAASAPPPASGSR